MVKKYFSQFCCLIVLLASINPLGAVAQGMGMGRGMGGGRGGRSKQSSSQSAQPDERVNPFAPDADPVEGVEARTAAMEKFIFGREETKAKIEVRVQRLEKKLIPYDHHTAAQPLNKRVDRLWSVLAAANNKPKPE